MQSNVVDIRDAALSCYMKLRTEIDETINRSKEFEGRGMKKTAGLVLQGLRAKREKLAKFKSKLKDFSKRSNVVNITIKEQRDYAKVIKQYRDFYSKGVDNVQGDSSV